MDNFINSNPELLCIAVFAVLTAAGIIISRLDKKDLQTFRETISPGTYAKVKTANGVKRAKLIKKNVGEQYLFRAVDQGEVIFTNLENIYPL